MTNRREAFGEKLRRHRELRGASLEVISQSTKISSALFLALEQGSCSRWPAGVYSRAYVRSYADALGLDVAEVVAEFCECFPEIAYPTAGSGGGGADRPRPPVAGNRLRLTLGEDPAERRSQARWRLLTGVAEAAGFAVLAAIVAFVARANYWVVLAVVSLIGHLLLVASGHGSIVASLRARHPRRHGPAAAMRPEAADDGEMTAPAPTAA